MFDFNKKEKPFTSFSGFGGGGLGLAGGAIKLPTYVDDVFSTFLYEGNQSARSINNGIDLSGEGGLVWIKSRSDTFRHALIDTERGAGKMLASNETSASTPADLSGLSSFNTNGFSLGNESVGYQRCNMNNNDYVSWTFRKTPGFFDIVTYTGDGTNNRNIAHSLNSTPGFIIVKQTSHGSDWVCWHRSLGTDGIILNSSNAKSAYTAVVSYLSQSTSSNLIVGTNDLNQSGRTYVAYIFAHDDQSFGTDGDESIIKCGKYTGTGSDNNQIDIGFEAQWVLLKNITSSGPWILNDVIRGMAANDLNSDTRRLRANTNDAESNDIYASPYGNGFVVNGTGSFKNASGDDYIYIAIRRSNKPPESAINVFAMDTSGATSPSPPQFTSGFVADFIIRKTFNGANNQFGSRLMGTYYMSSYSTSAQNDASSLTWDFIDGWSGISGVDTNLGCYMFKRAPGFMDVVAYNGTGSTNNITHNLGVIPELQIVKRRNSSDSWITYTSKIDGSNDYMYLDTASSKDNSSQSVPSATAFTWTGSSPVVNASNSTYITYLFATLPGISKVGTYSGNSGNNVNVDCGFAAGARFILIKRTDSTGDWYVWDTLRGIGSGNDPYWLTNTTDNPVTNTDYVDPLSSGFTVTSSAPAALNASGGTYLFLAIA